MEGREDIQSPARSSTLSSHTHTLTRTMSMSRRLDRTVVRPSHSHASHVPIDRGHSLLHSPSPPASPTSNGNSTTSHQSASAAAALSAFPAHSMDDDDDVASDGSPPWPRPSPTFRTTSIPAREDLWTEDATSTLVEAWGGRYIELNRGNLRQKHWQEVANAVNARHGLIKDRRRTDIQCKNRIDTLKKKYKIEKSKVIASKSHYTSPWPFFLRLDSLIGNSFKPPAPTPSPEPTLRRKAPQLPALPPPSSVPVGRRSKRPAPAPRLVDNSHCRRNFSTMAAAAAAVEAEESDTSGWSARNHPRREREMDMDMDGAEAYRQLAKAIARFGKIYQRVEEEKQRQMVELEKQKMQFAKDLELQRLKLFMESQVQFQKLKRSKRTPESDMEDVNAMRRRSSSRRAQAKSDQSEQLGRARVAATLAGTVEVLPTVVLSADKGKEKVSSSKASGKRSQSTPASLPSKKSRVEEPVETVELAVPIQIVQPSGPPEFNVPDVARRASPAGSIQSVASPSTEVHSVPSLDTPPRAGPILSPGTHSLEFGRKAVMDIADESLNESFNDCTPSRLAGIMGIDLTHFAAGIKSFANRLAQAHKDRREANERVAELEKEKLESVSRAELTEALARITEFESAAAKAQEDIRLSQDLASSKIEELNRVAEDANQLRQELAVVVADRAKLRADLKTSQGEVLTAQGELVKTRLSLEGRVSELERQLAEARKTASPGTAVAEFRKSSSYLDELLSYYDKGKAQILRVAAACGTPLRDLVKWGDAELKGALARRGHELVPYQPEELELISRKDAELGCEPWVPPPVFDNNVPFLLDAMADGDEVDFDGEFKLGEFEGAKSNQDEHARSVHEAESRIDP